MCPPKMSATPAEPPRSALWKELETTKEPVLMKVGLLGDEYWEWTHKGVSGVPRFFGPEIMENLSRCPWYTIPCLYMPALVIYVWRHAMVTHGQSLLEMMPNILMGIVVWQMLEYSIHRWLFHYKPSSYWGITLHFLFHGNHHKWPGDKLRLVFPPLPGSIAGKGIHMALNTIMPPGTAAGCFIGLVIGYIAYDCCHYFIHHGGCGRGGLLRLIREAHTHHHVFEPDAGFGISSTGFDYLFQTLPHGKRH